ncbi:MAG TPA: serine/threonine-protein kinase [Solirubrobacteraceae bacterium]|jgi:serine/threonine protein kinase|nr:serine/threonine-protein kinase [Solirubrobacteraceae bacterium]
MDKPDRTTSNTTASAAGAERATPRTVGRYEILQEIGRGGMGVVYKARQPDLDRLVALKELRSVDATTPELVQRFVRESRLAGSLNHPNIVTVHDYVEERGTSYIAMEYMPRGSLRPWVGGLSLAQLAGVLEGLLAGLAAVEPSGIVHRDLKPENLMLTGEGRVKITDFGIAKTTQSASVASFVTATGTTVGTPAYMAPEQALAHTIGPWTDLYSVGVMTYEQLVGRLPFHDSPTPVAILLRHVNESIPPVIDSRPDVDPSLSEWVARLLVKEFTGRTQSAAQAWEELEEIVLDLLGPRWRRDARLPERGSSASSPKPLTPAPFVSRSLKTPDWSPTPEPSESPPPPLPSSEPARAPAQPEAESGFLSYGRAPTGVEQQQPQQRKPVSLEPTPESAPISVRLESSSDRPPDTSRGPAAASAERAPPRFRARRVGAVAFLTALTATAGFVLASAGESARTTAHSGGVSANASSYKPSRAYATALSEAISTLNGVRAAAGAQLAHARTAHEQATAAQHLAHAQEQAAAAIRKAGPGPPERATNAAIATALTYMGRGYSTMASAASRKDRRGFDDGRKAVTAATASLAATFVQLHKLGYRLGG